MGHSSWHLLKYQEGNADLIPVLLLFFFRPRVVGGLVTAHPRVRLSRDTGGEANAAKLKMGICRQRSAHGPRYNAESAFNI